MPLIEEAMAAALSQFDMTTGETFPVVPQLLLVEDSDFWAEAAMNDCTLVISVTEGLIETVSTFWVRFMSQQSNEPEHDDPIPATADELIHTSLVWLLLHELHHYQMGHFTITGRFSLSEARDANSFGVLKRGSTALPTALKNVPRSDLKNVEPCLEMQADHDAIEMVLDAYSPDGWRVIRARTAAISAMIVLIEREDSKRGHNLSSHPKAATRVFQLLMHVVQMPRIDEIIARQHPELDIDPHIPSSTEIEVFNRHVARASFFDVLELARAAGAVSIATDLETTEGFFRDMTAVRIGDQASYTKMSTVGSKQWVELERVNNYVSPVSADR